MYSVIQSMISSRERQQVNVSLK